MLQKRQSSETPVGSNSETVDKEVSQETEITESDCQDTTPDPLASSAEQHRTRTVSRSFSYQKSKFSVSLYCIAHLMRFLELRNLDLIELTFDCIKINRTNNGNVNMRVPQFFQWNHINTL